VTLPDNERFDKAWILVKEAVNNKGRNIKSALLKKTAANKAISKK